MIKPARYALQLLCLLAFIITLTPFSLRAQGSLNLFGGYSYTNYGPALPAASQPVNPAPVQKLHGWEFSLEGKIFPFVGLVADFSGHYGTEAVSLGCSLNPATPGCAPVDSRVRLYNFLFGPQISISMGRFTPFMHALAGVSEAIVGFTPSNSTWALGDALGGGLDYRLIPRLSLRGQADLLQTRFFIQTLQTAKTNQNNLRFSAGVVLHF